MNGPEARADIQEDVHPVYSMLGDRKATRQLGRRRELKSERIRAQLRETTPALDQDETLQLT